MRFLDAEFESLPDHRAGNTKYALSDVLKAAFAMFSLKSPSLLDFKTQTVPEENNLRTIYRIEGDIPCDNQMRGILDPLDPALLRPIFHHCFLRLRRAGVIHDYEFWGKFVIVTLDGVEHFSSAKVHCPHCLSRTHRNGEVSYYHAGLAAVLVNPAQAEVFPLEFEPIVKQDGSQKNDCELNAAKRITAQLDERYAELPILLTADALYANAPFIRRIIGYGWKFILNVKPDSHVSLFKQFAGRRARGDVGESAYTDQDGVRHHYVWTNRLCLSESGADVAVNFLQYECTTAAGETTCWTWVTNLPLTKASVERVAAGGRSRWKIENETFNTLKNQGYHFEHNYGHGRKHLATILALLMLTAFLVDQVQQRCSSLFRRVWRGVGTKAKVWATMRSLFRVLRFDTMEALFRQMAALYRLQLE